jgi:hypothetical protein
VLNDTVNIACNLFIVPFLNKSKQHNLLSLAGTDMHLKRLDYGEPGFQIPTVDGVTFVNPEIVLGQVSQSGPFISVDCCVIFRLVGLRCCLH